MSDHSSVETITRIIRRRRTIKPKCFSQAPIDRSIIEQIVENANWAPTHGMTQPWRLTIFTGTAREKLADFLAQTYKAVTTPETFKQNKYDGMRINPTLAPVVIAIGMKRQSVEKVTELDELLAVACAVQNMHLTATAHGLGGFWSTNDAAVSDQMRQYLNLDPQDRAMGLFYLGSPIGTWPSGNRTPMDAKVTWREG